MRKLLANKVRHVLQILPTTPRCKSCDAVLAPLGPECPSCGRTDLGQLRQSLARIGIQLGVFGAIVFGAFAVATVWTEGSSWVKGLAHIIDAPFEPAATTKK